MYAMESLCSACIMRVPNGLLPRQLQVDESHSRNYDLSLGLLPAREGRPIQLRRRLCEPLAKFSRVGVSRRLAGTDRSVTPDIPIETNNVVFIWLYGLSRVGDGSE